MTQNEYLISQACKATGVSRTTLYWWEKKGSLKPSKRINPYSKNEDRFYSDDDLIRIKILKILKTEKGNEFFMRLLLEVIKANVVNGEELDRLSRNV